MPTQMNMKKFLPVLIIVLLFLGYLGNGVRNWLFDMINSSYRTTGQYAQLTKIPAAPVVLPKDSYICNSGQKRPWIGCMIR